jgi:hypothetical protein
MEDFEETVCILDGRDWTMGWKRESTYIMQKLCQKLTIEQRRLLFCGFWGEDGSMENGDLEKGETDLEESQLCDKRTRRACCKIQ